MIAAQYSNAEHTEIKATVDGTVWHCVRLNGDNEINRRVLDWVSGGGVISSYVEPVLVLSDYQRAIQAHVDTTASTKGYDNGASCAGYANSGVPAWAAEASAFITWRDTVWLYAYEQLAAVEAQQRAQPTPAELVAELPAMIWPE